MNYNTAKLRQFINDYFGSEELRTLLFDYFRPVHDELTEGMRKSRQIALLLEYCHNHRKFPDLLAAIGRERSFFQPDDYVQGQKTPTATPKAPAQITRNPRQIFISHAHQDAEVAQKLAHDLEAHGYNIWIAPDSIRPGEKWVEAINRGLEESGIFVLLLSPDAVASRWVQMETNAAIEFEREGEIQLYPLMLKACRMPALWRSLQRISFVGSYEKGRVKLLAVLKSDKENNWSTIFSNISNKDKNTSLRESGFQTDHNKTYKRLNYLHEQEPNLELEVQIHPKVGIHMVRIPTGKFLYGYEREELFLDEFWIAKTLVTNSQYSRFVAENSLYAHPEYWQGNQPPANIINHPVVNISWQHAVAYAKWVNAELPTEMQWEKAARGTRGRAYPWGSSWSDFYCNTKEAGLKGTTPVGHFSPNGDSPYQCTDMAGNVWEWTNSRRLPGSPSRVVVRGGSWDNDMHKARADFRGFCFPSQISFSIGFRFIMHRLPGPSL